LNRRGVTLIEVLMAATLMGLIGIVLSRLLINDSRFVAKGNAMTDARQAARAALNTMVNELRMVGDSGVLAATDTTIQVRMPYAFGVSCEKSGTALIASIMPPDSIMYNQTLPWGIMWRDSVTGYYTTTNKSTGITVAKTVAAADILKCTQDSIRVVPNGFAVKITPAAGGTLPPINGNIFFLYNTVTYGFLTSTMMPGRKGLWRLQSGGTNTELVAPFDASSGFEFDTGAALATVKSSKLSSVYAIRGLYLKLIGASEHTPIGTSAPEKFDFRTHVLFLNRSFP
jgi:Tfp pilus assembly protein PilX